MRKLTRKQAQGVNHVSGHPSTMSRDMTLVGLTGFESVSHPPPTCGKWCPPGILAHSMCWRMLANIKRDRTKIAQQREPINEPING
jgi:hypothetical protein